MELNNTCQNKQNWELRSREFGSTLKSVLLKNVPHVINHHIHTQHIQWITRFLQAQTSRVLDIGCGYGRLTVELLKVLPDLDITGVDISSHYVKLFRENTGKPAVEAGVENLPDHLEQFDIILCVTVFMYVDTNNLQQAFLKLKPHLTNHGKIIIIENTSSGQFFLNPFGIRKRLKKTSSKTPETGGKTFNDSDIQGLANNSGFSISEIRRMPMTTLLIIPMYFLAKIFPEKLCSIIFKPIAFLDKILARLFLPTIHTAYLLEQKDL